MNEDRKETFAAVVVVAFIIITVLGPIVYDAKSQEQEEVQVAKYHLHLPEFNITKPDISLALEVEENREKAYKAMWQVNKIKERMSTVMLPTVEIKKTNLGKYYITGYTSVECGGSTMTASGATCHKASSYEDSFFNPTTCAIDPALHDFSDLFYLEEFGCFIAEDTGSAVKGKHLDLYFWDNEYNYALSITGYYTVYSIEFIYGEVPATNYDIQKKVSDKVIGWKVKGS